MDRILAMSLVGAGPGNIFGPGMSAGALESFARDAGRVAKAAEGSNSSRGGAAAGGTRSASAAGSGGKCSAADAAERTGEKEANSSGASANVTTRSSCPAFDQRFYFVDAIVAPY